MAVSLSDIEKEIKYSRVPNFIVIHGVLHYFIGSFKGILMKGYPVHYRKHGSFELISAEEGKAIINHRAPSRPGSKKVPSEQKIIIPLFFKARISRGEQESVNLTPADYRVYEEFLSKDTEHPEGLADKYLMLFETFQAYWPEHYSPSMQEEIDASTFVLGARIRYGMACAMQGRAIPNDCQYDILLAEVDGIIAYTEAPVDWD